MPSDTWLSQGQVFGAQRGLGAPVAGTREYQIGPASLGVDEGLPMYALLRVGISGSMGDQTMSEDVGLGLGLLLMGAWGGLQVAWRA